MSRRSGVRTADMDTQAYDELGQLMKEYPDWKQRFPDIHAELNPIRYTKNRVNAPKAENIRVSRRAGDPTVSDYQAEFTPKQGLRPRSSKRPPPTPRGGRGPPMQTSTIQKDHYESKFEKYEGRPADFKKEEVYQAPKVKFETQTGYSRDFPIKELPASDRRGPPERSQRKKNPGKFDGRTTNKETFRTWKPEKQVCFSELPTFTDSVLYPDQSRNLETTTATTFKGTTAPKPEPIRLGSPNIRLEGDRDFNTVNRNTYKQHEGARPASMIVHKPELVAQARSRFESKSMNMTDYCYKNKQPRKPCSPARPTIDLRFNNKTSFSTEQRQQYPGIDVTSAPQVPSYKPDNGEYRPPSQKFETQTKHQLDYRPLDVMASYVPPAKPPTDTRSRKLPKFVDNTTSKDFFRRWETEPRRQYGDIHEALQFVRSDVFVPTKEKFTATSTTMDTFQGKPSTVPEPFIPIQSSIDNSGSHDFGTVYRSTYDGPQMEKTLSKKQAAKLLSELRKRKDGHISAPARVSPQKPVAAQC